MILVLSCRLDEGECRPGALCSREWMLWWSDRHRPPSEGWWGLGQPGWEEGDCYEWPARVCVCVCVFICDRLAIRGWLLAMGLSADDRRVA